MTQANKSLHTYTSYWFCFSGWTLTDTGHADFITWLYHNLVSQFPVVGYCTELSCCPFGTINPLTAWNCPSQYAVSWMVPGWRLPVRATCAKFASEMPTGSRCYWHTMVVRHKGSHRAWQSQQMQWLWRPLRELHPILWAIWIQLLGLSHGCYLHHRRHL